MTTESQTAPTVVHTPIDTPPAGRYESGSVDSFKAFEAAVQGGGSDAAPATDGPDDQGAAQTQAASPAAPAAQPTPSQQAQPTADGNSDKPTGNAPAAGRPAGKAPAAQRINELTKARREAERQVAARDAELAALRAENERLKAGAAPADATIEAMKAGDAEPDPSKFQFGELDTDYVRAVARYEAKQIAKASEASRSTDTASPKETEARARWDAQVEAADQRHGDWVEKVVEGFEKGTWTPPEHIGKMFGASDQGAEMLYMLASDPAESARVAALDPVGQQRWFFQTEARLAQPAAPGQQQAQNTPHAPAHLVPSAQPPVEQARGAGGRFTVNSDTTDFAAFEARFQKDLQL